LFGFFLKAKFSRFLLLSRTLLLTGVPAGWISNISKAGEYLGNLLGHPAAKITSQGPFTSEEQGWGLSSVAFAVLVHGRRLPSSREQGADCLTLLCHRCESA